MQGQRNPGAPPSWPQGAWNTSGGGLGRKCGFDNKEIGRGPRKQICGRTTRFLGGGFVLVAP